MIKKFWRAMGLLVAVALALVYLVGCGNDSADLDPAEAVNIRFRNETGLTIERLWLGAGPEQGSTFQTRYTDIEPGEETGYQTVEANVDNYNRTNFTIDGERYGSNKLDPHVVLGVESLAVGSYYTLVLTLDGVGTGATLSEVTVDVP